MGSVHSKFCKQLPVYAYSCERIWRGAQPSSWKSSQHPEASLRLPHSATIFQEWTNVCKIHFSNDFLDTWNYLRALRRFTLVHAFTEMLKMISSQLQVFEKVSPRCLCEWVSSIIAPSMDIGCVKRSFLLRNQHRQCLTWFEGYKSTACPYRNSSGQSTIIYKLVSSANNQIEHPMCLTMSIIKNRNIRGPRIEPWGTPASPDAQSDACPFITTRCRRFDKLLGNQLTMLSEQPIVRSLKNNPLYHTLSKALLMSQKTNCSYFLALIKSITTYSIVRGSVKNNWELVNIFLLGQQFYNLFKNIFDWNFIHL